MIDTWKKVDNQHSKLVWKEIEKTNLDEILQVEKLIGSEPFYCKITNSVVFKTKNSDINITKEQNYSELVLFSRYLNTENKLYDLLKS